jgi:hypothetical protein
MLRLAVPVSVSSDGSALAQEAARRVARSVRFREEEKAPFEVRASSRGSTVDVCLLDNLGTQFACASGEGVTLALNAFHLAAFAPKVSLTQSDLKSLDGSPMRIGADEAVNGLLEP